MARTSNCRTLIIEHKVVSTIRLYLISLIFHLFFLLFFLLFLCTVSNYFRFSFFPFLIFFPFFQLKSFTVHCWNIIYFFNHLVIFSFIFPSLFCFQRTQFFLFSFIYLTSRVHMFKIHNKSRGFVGRPKISLESTRGKSWVLSTKILNTEKK